MLKIPAHCQTVGSRDADFFDGMNVSPCRTCGHFGKLPADKCIKRKECPLNIQVLITPEQREGSKSKRGPCEKVKSCQFPACKEKIRAGGMYCRRHSTIIAKRRRRYPGNPEVWTLPEGVGLRKFISSGVA